jgi:hypothetical protein
MASIEITENTVIRNLIRKGTNANRETITLASGELGFSTDSERVFIGNGTAQGGTAAGDYLVVGNKFLGEVGSFSDANALPGDTFKLGSNLYARKTDYSGSVSDESGYDLLGQALSAGNGLALDGDNLSVKIDTSGTLAFTGDGSLTVGTLTFDDFPILDANTLIGNFTTGSSVPQAVAVDGNSVMGRQSTSTLGSVTFDQILLGADGTGTTTSKPTVSGLTVTELGDGTNTRYVQADANGTLTSSATGASIMNFIAGLDVYNPIVNQQATATYEDNWVTWTGDASIPAGAKNVIVQCYLDLSGVTYRMVDVKGRVSTSLESLGYVIISAEAQPQHRGLGRYNGAAQAFIPCGANGAFQYTVNVTKGQSRTAFQPGWTPAPNVGGAGTGVPNINAGLLIQVVGYTL